MLDVKKGDAALAVYGLGGRREAVNRVTVASVGPKWITTSGAQRFARNGYGERGWTLHTETSLAETRRREAALGVIHSATHQWRSLSVEALEQVVALLAPADRRDDSAARAAGG